MSASRDDGKKFAKEYDRSVAGRGGGVEGRIRAEYVRNHWQSNAIGLVYGGDDGETAKRTRSRRRKRREGRGRRRQRDAKESGEKSFIIAQLWNEEVSYETTPREY